MTITDDPRHPLYRDEASVRGELARVFDVCGSCRRCVDVCPAFPTLFELLDATGDEGAGMMTPAQQDRVIDSCFHCTACRDDCPYTPERDAEAAVDVPRLMLRARAMRHDSARATIGEKTTTMVLGRTDLVGRLGTRFEPLANRIVHGEPRSAARRLVARFLGVSARRRLQPFATQRFSVWFSKRPKIHIRDRQAVVTVFPTCLVEYRATDVGKDLVKVYERNGIECADSAAGCCGAPYLYAGDIDRFRTVAEKNVRTLAAEIRSGTDVVVPQPTCSHVLKDEYPRHVGQEHADDAALVSAQTYDAAEYLMSLHRADDYVLNTDFVGDVPRRITYHVPDHLRAQDIGLPGRDLMRLTGAGIRVVHERSGTEGRYSLRAEHDDVAGEVEARLGAGIDAAAGDVVAVDCQLTNMAIAEQTGREVTHPLQLIARAYGIPPEDPSHGNHPR